MRNNLKANCKQSWHQPIKGFTLIETIVGIVVLGIAFSLLITLIYPITEHSASQLHQIKAAELAQSFLNEIQNKAFDENSDKAGGRNRCGENGVDCTSYNGLGADTSEDRQTYDDVDDYDDINFNTSLENSLQDINFAALYQGFKVNVDVCNDGDYDGTCSSKLVSNNDTDTAKLITVTVETPTGEQLTFATYRANF